MSTVLTRSARKFARVTFALGAILALAAFRHTDIEGYTDPAYTGYTFRTVVVQFPNANLQFRKYAIKQLEKRFRKLKIRMVQHDELFAPTRQWTAEESRAIYESHGIDAGLVITIGSTGSQTTPGGVLFNASTVGGTTTGQAVQVQYSSDHASFEIALVDVATEDTVWIGSLDTRGAGLMFTGLKSTAKGLVKGLVNELQSAGHLPRR